MDQIKSYIISVVCVGIVCAISCRLLIAKGMNSALIKLLSGVVITITMLMPVLNFDVSGIMDYLGVYSYDASQAVASGVAQTKQAIRDGIKQRSEEYILKEASRLNLDITVCVELSNEDLPVPIYVELEGDASPYAKNALTQSVCTAFDLVKENVQWT